jgi:2-desacetyl-2-hydroxyethyl bacteriochlorophyllide A dehydrogenase
MRAVVFDSRLRFDPQYPIKDVPSGEVLIRAALCGICNTDLEIIKGYGGFTGILGHEFCGIVQSAGPLFGKRVVGEINVSCGRCRLCLTGRQKHCPARTVLGIVGRDGAMADYLTLPAANLFEIPEEITNTEAVLIEPLAAALQILEQVSMTGSTRILVLGDGKLGLLCAMVLNLHGGDVVLSGKHSGKMQLAAEAGVKIVHKDKLAATNDFDLVVDATGSDDGLAAAITQVCPEGTIVLKTTTAAATNLNTAPIVINEITIIGSRCGPFQKAIDLLDAGKLDVTRLITASYPVEEALAAFAHASDPNSVKIVLTFDS